VIALAGGLSIPVGAYLLALTAAAPLRARASVAPLLIVQARCLPACSRSALSR
jgi:hypothetical protein